MGSNKSFDITMYDCKRLTLRLNATIINKYDLILVTVVAEIEPISDPSRWQEVAKIVQEKTGKLCSAHRASEHSITPRSIPMEGQ